ncbi:general substrate transporter [Aspergillus aurantiobrunneus]
MGIKAILGQTALANYGRQIKLAPREIIFSRSLIISSMMYASAAITLTWDQGMGSTVPSLPGFQNHFGISSGSDAAAIKNFVSLVYLGDAAGAALSFFINDRIGRLWSFRLYCAVWILGQIVAISSPGVAGLYASRIISGLGIGALSVTSIMSIVEIAPAEIRGLLAAWYSVGMGIGLMVADFCVYGVELHVSPSRLQYQTVWFAPCIFMFLWCIASFFLCESPRWLLLRDRHDEAVQTLVRLRGLPLDHPRVHQELLAIKESIRSETAISAAAVDDHSPSKVVSIARETFTVPSNLRRLQQALILYVFPQLSGGNSITNYFIPVLEIIGVSGDSTRHLFLTCMYALSKFFFSLFASFLFIDVLGRRNSLFVGISIQMLSDVYVGVYTKIQQDHGAPRSAGEAALAAIFLHALGYSVGLLTLPYVFGGELWPNRIRSFGAALTQTFHWLFHYAMTYALPSLLERTNNWGAFIFFAAWCCVAFCYVYLLVPEMAGYSVEEIDALFRGPWRVNGTRVGAGGKGVDDGGECVGEGEVEGEVLEGRDLERVG